MSALMDQSNMDGILTSANILMHNSAKSTYFASELLETWRTMTSLTCLSLCGLSNMSMWIAMMLMWMTEDSSFFFGQYK